MELPPSVAGTTPTPSMSDTDSLARRSTGGPIEYIHGSSTTTTTTPSSTPSAGHSNMGESGTPGTTAKSRAPPQGVVVRGRTAVPGPGPGRGPYYLPDRGTLHVPTRPVSGRTPGTQNVVPGGGGGRGGVPVPRQRATTPVRPFHLSMASGRTAKDHVVHQVTTERTKTMPFKPQLIAALPPKTAERVERQSFLDRYREDQVRSFLPSFLRFLRSFPSFVTLPPPKEKYILYKKKNYIYTS